MSTTKRIVHWLAPLALSMVSCLPLPSDRMLVCPDKADETCVCLVRRTNLFGWEEAAREQCRTFKVKTVSQLDSCD